MSKRALGTTAALAALAFLSNGIGGAAQVDAQAQTQPESCAIDLAQPECMTDIVSNALILGLGRPEADVRAFLNGAETRYATGSEVLTAAAARFKLDEAKLSAEVERFRHVNCEHETTADGASGTAELGELPVSKDVLAFARDVTLHVVLHELGHALIREFDIPVLGNEETAADAFATYYLTTYRPDRAVRVLIARVTSLMIEAGETSAIAWGGEHDHDARRANQIAALAVAAGAEKYQSVAAAVAMSEDDVRSARDYGAEIFRSWRRVLAPHWMPEGAVSSEARFLCDAEDALVRRLCSDGLADEIASALKRFDWHSQVTVRFVDGDGGAGWNRNGRTITVHSAYIRRFIEQGRVRSAPE